MDTALLQLLEALEDISHEDESLFNTVVRQAMSNALVDGFARLKPGYILPSSFGLATAQADRQVREVIERYLGVVQRLAVQQGLTTFHQRLAAIQNASIKTNEGNDYEEFIGYSNPAFFDEDGRVIRLM
jgi:hypothetical protein